MQVVAGMKDERVGVSEIAQRLELTAAEVRALLKDLPMDTATSGVGESTEDGGDVVSNGAEVPVRESVNA